jgi:glycosyltransferase involved in cell wall biosynthesis
MQIWINTLFDALPGEKGLMLRYGLLAEALVKKGHPVVIWSSDFHHATKQKRRLPMVSDTDGIQVRLIPTLPYESNISVQRWHSHHRYGRDWACAARQCVLSKAVEKPDLILVASPPLELFDAGYRLSQVWQAKMVLDIQDRWPETFYQLLPRPLRGLGQFIFLPLHCSVRRARRLADGVCAVSAQYLQDPRQQGTVFPLGTVLPKMGPRQNDDQALRLCYVGNFGATYLLEVVIAGLRKLHEAGSAVSLDVVGDGVKRPLIEAAVQAGLPIRYHGYVEGERMSQVLFACACGIVPMAADSCVAVPNKFVDYAAHGLAIINGLRGESERLIVNHQAGINYRVHNVDSFVDAVLQMHRNRSLLNACQINSRRMAETCFDAWQIYDAMADWLVSKGQVAKAENGVARRP